MSQAGWVKSEVYHSSVYVIKVTTTSNRKSIYSRRKIETLGLPFDIGLRILVSDDRFGPYMSYVPYWSPTLYAMRA